MTDRQQPAVWRVRGGIAACIMAMAMAGGAIACGGDKGTDPMVTPPKAEAVARIDVSAPSTTLAPGQAVQFNATAFSTAGTSIGNAVPAWSSSVATVATVSQSGVVTAVAQGTTIVRATVDGVSGVANVTVTSGSGVLSSIAVSAPDATLELGDGTQVTVSGRDAGGATIGLGTRAVTFTTSNASIASVSASGFVSAVGVGAVTVQASVQDGTVARTGTVSLTITGVAGAPVSARVDMLPMSFLPYETLIKQNGTISFVFPSLAHNVIWDRRLAGAPADIGTINNVTITRSFPTSGVFNYECTIHPGMIGRIIVSP